MCTIAKRMRNETRTEPCVLLKISFPLRVAVNRKTKPLDRRLLQISPANRPLYLLNAGCRVFGIRTKWYEYLQQLDRCMQFFPILSIIQVRISCLSNNCMLIDCALSLIFETMVYYTNGTFLYSTNLRQTRHLDNVKPPILKSAMGGPCIASNGYVCPLAHRYSTLYRKAVAII